MQEPNPFPSLWTAVTSENVEKVINSSIKCDDWLQEHPRDLEPPSDFSEITSHLASMLTKTTDVFEALAFCNTEILLTSFSDSNNALSTPENQNALVSLLTAPFVNDALILSVLTILKFSIVDETTLTLHFTNQLLTHLFTFFSTGSTSLQSISYSVLTQCYKIANTPFSTAFVENVTLPVLFPHLCKLAQQSAESPQLSFFLQILSTSACKGNSPIFREAAFLDIFKESNPFLRFLSTPSISSVVIRIILHLASSADLPPEVLTFPQLLSYLTGLLSRGDYSTQILRIFLQLSRNQTCIPSLLDARVAPSLITVLLLKLDGQTILGDYTTSMSILSSLILHADLTHQLVTSFANALQKSIDSLDSRTLSEAHATIHKRIVSSGLTSLLKLSSDESSRAFICVYECLSPLCMVLLSTHSSYETKLLTCRIIGNLSSVPDIFLQTCLVQGKPQPIITILTHVFLKSVTSENPLIALGPCMLTVLSHSPTTMIMHISDDETLKQFYEALKHIETEKTSIHSTLQFLALFILNFVQHAPDLTVKLFEQKIFTTLLEISRSHLEDVKFATIQTLCFTMISLLLRDSKTIQILADNKAIETMLIYLLHYFGSKTAPDGTTNEEILAFSKDLLPISWNLWVLLSSDAVADIFQKNTELMDKIVNFLCQRVTTTLTFCPKDSTLSADTLDPVQLQSLNTLSQVVGLIFRILSHIAGDSAQFVDQLIQTGSQFHILLQSLPVVFTACSTLHTAPSIQTLNSGLTLLTVLLANTSSSPTIIPLFTPSPDPSVTSFASVYLSIVKFPPEALYFASEQLVHTILILATPNTDLMHFLLDNQIVSVLLGKLGPTVHTNSDYVSKVFSLLLFFFSEPAFTVKTHTDDNLRLLISTLNLYITAPDTHPQVLFTAFTITRTISTTDALRKQILMTDIPTRIVELLNSTAGLAADPTVALVATLHVLLCSGSFDDETVKRVEAIIESGLVPAIARTIKTTMEMNTDVAVLSVSILVSLSATAQCSVAMVKQNAVGLVCPIIRQVKDTHLLLLMQTRKSKESSVINMSDKEQEKFEQTGQLLLRTLSLLSTFTTLSQVLQGFIDQDGASTAMEIAKVYGDHDISRLYWSIDQKLRKSDENKKESLLGRSLNHALTILHNLTGTSASNTIILTQQTIPLWLELVHFSTLYQSPHLDLIIKIMCNILRQQINQLGTALVDAGAADIIMTALSTRDKLAINEIEQLVNLLSFCVVNPDQRERLKVTEVYQLLATIAVENMTTQRILLQERLLVSFTNLAQDEIINHTILCNEQGKSTGIVEWLKSVYEMLKTDTNILNRIIKTFRTISLDKSNVTIFASEGMFTIFVDLIRRIMVPNPKLQSNPVLAANAQHTNLQLAMSLIINPCVASSSEASIAFTQAGIVDLLLEFIQTFTTSKALTEIFKAVVNLTAAEDSLETITSSKLSETLIGFLPRVIEEYNPVQTLSGLSDPFFEKLLASLMNISRDKEAVKMMSTESFVSQIICILARWCDDQKIEVKDENGTDINTSLKLKNSPTDEAMAKACGIMVNMIKESEDTALLISSHIIPIAVSLLQFFLTDMKHFETYTFGSELRSFAFNVSIKVVYHPCLLRTPFMTVALNYLETIKEFNKEDSNIETVLSLISSTAHIALTETFVPSEPEFTRTQTILSYVKEKAPKDYLLDATFESNIDYIVDTAIDMMQGHKQSK
ncbi:hypothetical protein BLNAU_8988 [Blattamonas nauphoetae]|uniref:Uncharacterized protein n=1 Tax=Blattamonas nauphoetae TaxID=2049346 RepID=A0ABQ9XWY8_9EUKA|nr:hypothetical protein BLNAU_8988 [Blattamonas nauphoetae]